MTEVVISRSFVLLGYRGKQPLAWLSISWESLAWNRFASLRDPVIRLISNKSCHTLMMSSISSSVRQGGRSRNVWGGGWRRALWGKSWPEVGVVMVIVYTVKHQAGLRGGFKGRAQRMMELPQLVMFPQPQGPLLPALSESRERITPCNLAGSW